MRRRESDLSHFLLLRKLDAFARSREVSIQKESTQDELLRELQAALTLHRTNPTRLYGFRVESMFAHVTAALRGTEIITEEDSGIFFYNGDEMRRPDFRLLLNDGAQILVEVKNSTQRRGWEFTALTAAILIVFDVMRPASVYL